MVEKYKLFLYRRPLNHNFGLKLDPVNLDQVRQYKYLGTVIDEKLDGET